MPELPEVETYVRELEPDLCGRLVNKAQVFWERIIAVPTVAEFIAQMAGKTFTCFGRRGKYMLLGLDSGETLVVHLRMTGKLEVQPAATERGKHTHVLLDLDDGRVLHYTDPRKFGRLWLVEDLNQVIGKLGPEPLSDDFTPVAFADRLVRRQVRLKALLLDQQVVAGVGNIYADEALFLAGLHPERRGATLVPEEIERLHAAVRQVLARGIELRGSSLGGSRLQNYMRPSGEQGGFQSEHKVFQRTGEPCQVCGESIVRIVVAQRSTHFCPTCQPAE